MKILIGGDFAPTEFNFRLFENGDGESLYSKDMLAYLDRFDYRIYDFECVFEGKGESIKKNGPLLTCKIDTLPGILQAKPNLMILANNHINNQGTEGIKHTIDIFNKEGIVCVGAGKDRLEASKYYIIDDGDVKVGIYACAEHEFNESSETSGGVNPYDPLDTFDEITKAKQDCDYLIVFYHGGRIDYRYPLPIIQKTLRKMVESGADLVICQHTHCIGCMEDYMNGKIIYGQGDFLFARPSRDEYRYSGLLLQLNVSKNEIHYDYRIRIKPQDTIRLASEEEESEILNDFFERSLNCTNTQFVQEAYKTYIEEKTYDYMSVLIGNRKNKMFYRLLNKITNKRFGRWKLNNIYKEKEILSLLNHLECETHYSILKDCIKALGDIDE